ncbi:hypothetical protein Tco_1102693 [Tanacetum coccineum]
MPIELSSFNIIIGDETLMVQSNRSDGYASIVASEQRAELCGRIGTLEGDNMRLRGMLVTIMMQKEKKETRMKTIRNAATALEKKDKNVSVDSVITQLNEFKLKDQEKKEDQEKTDQEKKTTNQKSPKQQSPVKGIKISKKVVRKTLKKVKKSLKNKGKKTEDTAATDKKTRKY